MAALQNLLGFIKVELQPGAALTVEVPVDLSQMATAQDDPTFSRTLLHGTYTLSVGGHQPDHRDPEGAKGSSGPALTTTITVS